jgi:hypothetical protein
MSDKQLLRQYQRGEALVIPGIGEDEVDNPEYHRRQAK